MALTVRHTFQSAKADGGDATLVKPSDWNADHEVIGTVGGNVTLADTIVATTPLKNIVTVGATGADYTTIQAALDAISASGAGNRVTHEVQIIDQRHVEPNTVRWHGHGCDMVTLVGPTPFQAVVATEGDIATSFSVALVTDSGVNAIQLTMTTNSDLTAQIAVGDFALLHGALGGGGFTDALFRGVYNVTSINASTIVAVKPTFDAHPGNTLNNLADHITPGPHTYTGGVLKFVKAEVVLPNQVDGTIPYNTEDDYGQAGFHFLNANVELFQRDLVFTVDGSEVGQQGVNAGELNYFAALTHSTVKLDRVPWLANTAPIRGFWLRIRKTGSHFMTAFEVDRHSRLQAEAMTLQSQLGYSGAAAVTLYGVSSLRVAGQGSVDVLNVLNFERICDLAGAGDAIIKSPIEGFTGGSAFNLSEGGNMLKYNLFGAQDTVSPFGWLSYGGTPPFFNVQTQGRTYTENAVFASGNDRVEVLDWQPGV